MAAAWMAPVIALASAAPAQAASREPGPPTWTWTADYLTTRQALTYFTAINNADEDVPATFITPRFTSTGVELYGHGFGPWEMEFTSTAVVATAVIPARSSLTTAFIGYFTRTPPATATLVASLTPPASPNPPTLTLNFT